MVDGHHDPLPKPPLPLPLRPIPQSQRLQELEDVLAASCLMECCHRTKQLCRAVTQASFHS